MKTEQSRVGLDLCLKKSWPGKSHDAIVFERLRFQTENIYRPHGLVCMVGLTVEIKLRFQISLESCGRGLGHSTESKLYSMYMQVDYRRNGHVLQDCRAG